MVSLATVTVTQTEYPRELRGYKVERAVIEIRRPDEKQTKPVNDNTQAENANNSQASGQPRSDGDRLIQLGKPQLARVTPLGITFEIPIVVAPVKPSGHVDFLLFEGMTINGTSVDIDEYHRAFDLPNKKSLTLPEPLSVYLKLPTAVLAAIDEWSNSKETWPVAGRVYVCGKFKKSILSFKRCVPVEINTAIQNPLHAAGSDEAPIVLGLRGNSVVLFNPVDDQLAHFLARPIDHRRVFEHLIIASTVDPVVVCHHS